jgi:hypothetical protein
MSSTSERTRSWRSGVITRGLFAKSDDIVRTLSALCERLTNSLGAHYIGPQ